MTLTFYYPNQAYDPLPTSIDEYGAWQAKIAKAGGLIGPACWIVQTHLQLQSRGIRCRLTHERPRDGIVFAHYDDMPATRLERGGAYWVCILADRENIHPFANFHLVQNPYQTLRTRQGSAHILHWKQPGIIARSKTRGQTFKNVRFFGEVASLDPAFTAPAFTEWCTRERLDFRLVERDRWHDYSDCDVVLGIRKLDGEWVHGKPPSKLVNAWHAGVPAILGRESSFRALGESGRDYLEASSIDEVKRHLLLLRDDHESLAKIVQAGTTKANMASDDSISRMWIDTIDQHIAPKSSNWHKHSLLRLWHHSLERTLQGLVWRYRLIGNNFVER